MDSTIFIHSNLWPWQFKQYSEFDRANKIKFIKVCQTKYQPTLNALAHWLTHTVHRAAIHRAQRRTRKPSPAACSSYIHGQADRQTMPTACERQVHAAKCSHSHCHPSIQLYGRDEQRWQPAYIAIVNSLCMRQPHIQSEARHCCMQSTHRASLRNTTTTSTTQHTVSSVWFIRVTRALLNAKHQCSRQKKKQTVEVYEKKK